MEFTLCIGMGALHNDNKNFENLQRAAINWLNLEIEQIMVGETELTMHPLRKIRAEATTDINDEPCLSDLLLFAQKEASNKWLLLIDHNCILSHVTKNNIQQLCRSDSTAKIIVGRAWEIEQTKLKELNLSTKETTKLDELIDNQAIINGIDKPGWALFPKGILCNAPKEISCSSEKAIPWLMKSAIINGLPVLDGTAIAAILKPRYTNTINNHQVHSIDTYAQRAILPHTPHNPKLSLLLAAPEHELDLIVKKLCPNNKLAWEVIGRPAEIDDEEGLVAAWNSGLEVARGEIAWPITRNNPPIALIPIILKSFEIPGVDFLTLNWDLAGEIMSGDVAWHQQPGCLIAQTNWLKRLGAIPKSTKANKALLELKKNAVKRGAIIKSLPINGLN